MNFNKIKESLECEAGAPQVPETLTKLSGTISPLRKIRNRLIRSQIYFIVICFFCLSCVSEDFDGIMRVIGIIAFIQAVVLSLTYRIRIYKLVRSTKTIQVETRKTLQAFIHDFEIFIEVYKTSSIGMGLFYIMCLPYMTVSFIAGFKAGFSMLPMQEASQMSKDYCQSVNSQLITFLTHTSIVWIILVVLLLSLSLYLFNVIVLNLRYSKPLKELKAILASLES